MSGWEQLSFIFKLIAGKFGFLAVRLQYRRSDYNGRSLATTLRVQTMTMANLLDIEYRSHERVQKLIDLIRFCVEDISLSFERWEEPYVTARDSILTRETCLNHQP